MDIIDRIFDKFLSEFCPEVTEADADKVKACIRQEEGGQRHYAYSLHAANTLSRERQVFQAMRDGLNTAQIAERLGLSQRRIQQIIARTPLA